jgi:catechol 2,3-dioxygenase-like lactoylglutathione lyase family enzyme
VRNADLNSMLLASTEPERLHRWYADGLDPDEDAKVDHYRVLRFGRFSVMIDGRDDVATRNPDPARAILNLDVPDARATAARLDELGTTWVAPLEDRDGSLFATAADPDGNWVQLVQLSRAQRAAMADGDGGPLAGSEAFSSFAVPDLAEAERFYGEVLGLRVVEEEMGLLRLQLADGRDVLVYPKDDHVPAAYTILNFPVPDIERTVDALTARGVTFERYDGFDQDERGISQGAPLVAWFPDPAGNILAVLQT